MLILSKLRIQLTQHFYTVRDTDFQEPSCVMKERNGNLERHKFEEMQNLTNGNGREIVICNIGGTS